VADASATVSRRLKAAFVSGLRDSQGKLLIEMRPGERPASIHFLEKTPRNVLRIPFLDAVLPGCRFVLVYREPRSCISSIIEGWQSHAFVSYSDLPGSQRESWSFLLPPGWRRLASQSVREIAAFQWCSAVSFALEDLGQLAPERSCFVDYAMFVRDPATEVARICAFAEIPVDDPLRLTANRILPLSASTLRPPAPDKWRRANPGLRRLAPEVVELAERADWFARERGTTIGVKRKAKAAPTKRG
jgi:hypothetical protein